VMKPHVLRLSPRHAGEVTPTVKMNFDLSQGSMAVVSQVYQALVSYKETDKQIKSYFKPTKAKNHLAEKISKPHLMLEHPDIYQFHKTVLHFIILSKNNLTPLIVLIHLIL